MLFFFLGVWCLVSHILSLLVPSCGKQNVLCTVYSSNTVVTQISLIKLNN